MMFVAYAAAPAESQPAVRPGMMFLHYADPRFLEGLRRHGLLADYGLRLLNTGLDTRPFGEKWSGSTMLADARRSGRPYYLDRLCGGMPYQSLAGIDAVAGVLKDDPRFLGFQVHEWGNTPFHDHRRIQEQVIAKGLPFSRESFSVFDRQVKGNYLGGGDYDTYRGLFRPLNTVEDIDRYLDGYFSHYTEITAGQVMAVNGYVQLYHKALRLGAKNVMAEIGNQVPLTALQIACVRGAARQYGKPFGVYYEPWGGTPFGGTCALDRSPWFADTDLLKQDGAITGFRVGRQFGSSRSLHRRLLFYAWLAGATWCAEEWGTENYFANWDEYPLTDYGRVAKEFLDVSRRFPRPEPIVLAAIVMPPGQFGIDVRVAAGRTDRICETLPADPFNRRMRQFATDILAARPTRWGEDAFNLTPSPWIGCFDVLSAEAPPEMLSRYDIVVYFDADQARRSPAPKPRVRVYEGTPDDGRRIIADLSGRLRYRVEGDVGCAHARAAGRYLLGVFNNLGISKRDGVETADPQAAQSATVRGPCGGAECLFGREHIASRTADAIECRLPAGAVMLLSFADAPGPASQSGRNDDAGSERGGFEWHAFPDDRRFRVLGLHWFAENKPKLWRLPQTRLAALPTGVQNRSKCPSGGRILLRCDTTRLALKAVAANGGTARGFDVYVNGRPVHPSPAERPAGASERILFQGLDDREKEIVIYLPHGQDVTVTAIGVDRGARFGPPEHRFARPLPLVFYGSSVCQGSGAARSGMTYGAIVCRELNLDFVNLGFGGAGKAEKEVVALVNSIPACAYVFDLGKSYGTQDGTAYAAMLRAVRRSHPGVPIVCITPITSRREVNDEDYSRRSVHTRTVMRDAANDLLRAGEKDLYVVEGEDLLGFREHDGLSKDGVHPSDGGYAVIARKLAPVLRKALAGAGRLESAPGPDAPVEAVRDPQG